MVTSVVAMAELDACTIRELCDADLQRVQAQRDGLRAEIDEIQTELELIREEFWCEVDAQTMCRIFNVAFSEIARRVRLLASGASREAVLELVEIVERVERAAES